jgi:hypothetical protein
MRPTRDMTHANEAAFPVGLSGLRGEALATLGQGVGLGAPPLSPRKAADLTSPTAS